MEKPKNSIDYIYWWNENFDSKIDLSIRKLYTDVSQTVKYQFENSEEYKELIHQLYNYDSEYKRDYGYDLLMKKPEEINLDIKKWEDFRSKVWRKNVVYNTNWKEYDWDKDDCQPNKGWVTPDNWFEKINDIVRTKIVVVYFDGVQFLLDKMLNHFQNSTCECEPDWEAREEGYYAAHLNVRRYYELPVGIDMKTFNISVEIQITTQMKDVISSLTHKYYEIKREKLEPPDIKWQWNYLSDEFSPNYIGHIIHYIEGAVMQIRNRESVDGKK